MAATPSARAALLARRLVERGVRFVTVNYGGWDHHAKIWDGLGNKLPEFDSGFSALIDDMHGRGLLADTLVVWRWASSAARRRSTRTPAAITGGRPRRCCSPVPVCGRPGPRRDRQARRLCDTPPGRARPMWPAPFTRPLGIDPRKASGCAGWPADRDSRLGRERQGTVRIVARGGQI